MRDLYKRLDGDGVPKTIPWYVTELGYSAFGGAPLVQMPSALVTADIYGDVLGRGAAGAFAYGVTPDDPMAGQARCAGLGNLMFWLSDGRGRATYPMPALRAFQLLSQSWASGDRLQQLYPSRSELKDKRGIDMIGSYALDRSDGRWSVLLVNRSDRSVDAAVGFDHAAARAGNRVEIRRYSGRQYRWDRPLPGGHPSVDAPPAIGIDRSWQGRVMLDHMSLTVVTGTWKK